MPNLNERLADMARLNCRLAETLRSVAQHLSDAAYEFSMISQELFAANQEVTNHRREIRMAIRIDDLELSTRTQNCLKNSGITIMEQLVDKTLEEVRGIKHLGAKSFREIQEVVRYYNLEFRK